MKDDYLWDGSGEPDPEIQKLENLLGNFRHQQPAPDFSEAARQTSAARRRRSWRQWLLPALGAAAAVVLLIFTVSRLVKRQQALPTTTAGWSVSRVAGSPRVGSRTINVGRATARLGLGQTLVTDGSSRATVSIDTVGEIQVEPDTRLRLARAGAAQKQMVLERGTIHAVIWASPGEFVVDTPSAIAVDLGCAYTLHVDDSGAGQLHTTLGWVGFKLDGRESFIPAGAECATRPGIGPGTPYYEDAPEQLRAALTKLDFGNLAPDERAAALAVVLTQARKRDALTLWHLLARANPSERGRIYDRLAKFVPAPHQVTREGVLSLNQTMLDLWWNELGLGDTALWRNWERSWLEK